MTDEEQQAEAVRLKLESIHREILMEFADKIRRECADRAVEWLIESGTTRHQDGFLAADLRVAILGTEPAREES